ncbi:MAG TPA: O-antigen ligase family protein, partial [Thermoanaerobaculia bacterium]|nr:O-antigen ligase family protein [Thermoanaerobaculia bacterium]
LIYDNVGLAPGNEIPRMRSFPRNALTFAGVCVAVLPLAFFVLWRGASEKQRWIARLAIVGGLFGIAFSLARGAWAALLVGVVYLLIDGVLSGRRKLQLIATVVAAAVVLTGTFLLKYEADPLNARAGAEGSVGTRTALARDTFAQVTGLHVLLGYGSERPRDEEGNVPAGLRYIPEAGTHSTYLNYLFRTGVPGFVMLVALYLVAALYARRAAREAEGERRTLSQMLAMAVVIVAAHGVVLSLYVEPVYTLTASLLLGLALAGARNVRGSLLPWKRSPAATS